MALFSVFHSISKLRKVKKLRDIRILKIHFKYTAYCITLTKLFHVQTKNGNNLIHIIIAACSSAMVGEGRSNGEFVIMNGSNGELVIVNGSNGQMVAFWLESIFIGHPGQSEFLSFRGDPVRGSSVGVAINVVVSGFSVRIVTCAFHFLLDLGFLTGRVIRSRVTVGKKEFQKVNCIMLTPIVVGLLPPFAASIQMTIVVLAGDGDSAIFAFLVVAGRSAAVVWRRHVTRLFIVG
jgi:hypothetical protein